LGGFGVLLVSWLQSLPESGQQAEEITGAGGATVADKGVPVG
jgi:hypothetical protein